MARRLQGTALEIVRGEERGKRYELAQDELRIGRSPECEIILTGEAMSRHHATIYKAPGSGWMILDNNSKNGVLVNGSKVGTCPIKAGDLIQIGSHVFRFRSDEGQAELDRQEEAAGVPNYGAVLETPVASGSKRPLIYGGLVVLILALYFASRGSESNPATTEEAVKKTDALVDKTGRSFTLAPKPDLKNPESKKELAGIEDPVLKKAEQDMQGLDWSNTSLKEAEQYFRKGQRDYLSRNYGRAIDSFQTSLSLYRGHELAERYLSRAIYESEIEAKTHMEIAVSYFESLQYQRAIYHFSQVINLMAHRPTEPTVLQAEKYVAICKKRLQSAELFP